VERKMTKLLRLSEELAARKLKEKFRRDRIRETEAQKERDLRLLAESLEKKEQDRLLRKINRQVGYLRANVIDLAMFAKLPQGTGVDIITVGSGGPRSSHLCARELPDAREV
jgi:hypothetical protein